MALGYFSAWRQERMSNWRPLGEFASTKRISLPEGVGALRARVVSNSVYFMTNYLMVAVAFSLLTLLLAPRLAFLLSLPGILYFYLFVWKKDAEWTWPMVGEVTPKIKLAMVGVLLGLVFLFAASDFIWVIGATCVIVVAHCVFYKSKEEHEQDTMFDDPLPV